MAYFVEGMLALEQGESKVRRIGEYERLEDAIAAAERVIDEFLLTKLKPGMTAQNLFSIYQTCGEVPFIFRDGDVTFNVPGFNHFKHAMLRCNAICLTQFPSLLSDGEFEALTMQRRHRQS